MKPEAREHDGANGRGLTQYCQMCGSPLIRAVESDICARCSGRMNMVFYRMGALHAKIIEAQSIAKELSEVPNSGVHLASVVASLTNASHQIIQAVNEANAREGGR